MLNKLQAGQICCAFYDDIKIEAWIKKDVLFIRAYVPELSVDASKEFYQTLGILLENTKEYVQLSSRLHFGNSIDKNIYLAGRMETLYKYLVLLFRAKITHPLHSIFK